MSQVQQKVRQRMRQAQRLQRFNAVEHQHRGVGLFLGCFVKHSSCLFNFVLAVRAGER
jgi:hypothetical protein